jgi:hypothetical protein
MFPIIPGTPVPLSTNHIGPAIGQGEVEKQMKRRFALRSGRRCVLPVERRFGVAGGQSRSRQAGFDPLSSLREACQ